MLLRSAVGTEVFSTSQVKVHSPVESCVVSAAEFSNYTTVGLKQFQSIRYYLICVLDSWVTVMAPLFSGDESTEMLW